MALLKCKTEYIGGIEYTVGRTPHRATNALSCSLSLSPVSAHVWFFAAHADRYRRAISRFDSSSTRRSRKEGCLRALRAPPLPLTHRTSTQRGVRWVPTRRRSRAAPPALTMKRESETTMDHPRGGPAALTHTRTLCSLSIPPAHRSRGACFFQRAAVWTVVEVEHTLPRAVHSARAPLLLPLPDLALSLSVLRVCCSMGGVE